MNTRVRNIFIGLIVFAGANSAFAQYSRRVGPQMSWNAKLVLHEFYVHSQSRSYAQAHQLLSRNLQKNISVPSLSQQWQAFERAHGPIKNWGPARVGTAARDKANIWPRYVDFTHQVIGARSGAGTVSVRMVPENDSWHIDRINIQP